MNVIDFRLIPLIKRYDKLWGEEAFLIPCTLIRIIGNPSGRKYPIEVERLDFVTGQLVKDEGYTFQGALENFSDWGFTMPFNTACLIRRKGNGEHELKVYSIENIGIMETIYDVNDIVNEDEKLIMEIFNENYAELRDWLK